MPQKPVRGVQKSLFRIWERDKGICHLCEKPVEFRLASRDHINRAIKSSSLSNLALAHVNCNQRRGPMTVEEYKAVLKLPQREQHNMIRLIHRQYTRQEWFFKNEEKKEFNPWVPEIEDEA